MVPLRNLAALGLRVNEQRDTQVSLRYLPSFGSPCSLRLPSDDDRHRRSAPLVFVGIAHLWNRGVVREKR